MVKHNIHQLAMTGKSGFFGGMLTDTDPTSLQTTTPHYLNCEFEGCESFDELKRTNENVRDIVTFAMEAGAKTRDVVRLISQFNDTITKRAIFLIERDLDVVLPEGVTLLALGSEGRMEQTLCTDQDSAMAFSDDLPEEAKLEAERFAHILVDTLAHIGVSRCPGNTMASNPAWRKTESEWLALLEQCINVPTPEKLLVFGLFQDFRSIHGDMDLENRLRAPILEKASMSAMFLAHLARNVCRFPPALGLFDRFIVEKKGENKGKLNLKKAGSFTITEGVNLLATENKCWHSTTWDKLDELIEMKVLSDEDGTEVKRALTFLTRTRLRNQLKLLSKGQQPTDFIAPSSMRTIDQMRLKKSFKGVRKFIRILRGRYRVDLLPN